LNDEEKPAQDLFDAWNRFMFEICFPASTVERTEKQKREVEEAKAMPN
jgi:hypothetical protein